MDRRYIGHENQLLTARLLQHISLRGAETKEYLYLKNAFQTDVPPQ